jgi:urea transport system permease protein
VHILIMQVFNGLSLFTVLLLKALGLAVIFGLMGVINMAHGEFMALGAYATYVTALLCERYAPGVLNVYLIIAGIVAFIVAFTVGYGVEWALIRHLYKRPLDTLLATWGLSLVMQQIFRSVFGAQEVGVPLPDWLLGSWKATETIDIPLNGLFVMGLSLVTTGAVFLFLFRSRWGLRIRAVTQNRVMSGAVGINTKKVDRITFAVGCGLAGLGGSAFTTIGSTGPSSGQLYIVDTFLVVVFGGVQSLVGTIASAFTIAESQSSLEFFLSGSMAKVITLLSIIGILLIRPEGLFAVKVRR